MGTRGVPSVVNETSQHEQRWYPRILLKLPVRVYGELDENGMTVQSGLSENLSLGGALVSVPEYLPCGSRCRVKFVDASESIVPNYVFGTVRHITPGSDKDFLVGIEFSKPLAIIPAADTT